MLKVFVAQNPVAAHLVQGILEGEGIPAEVRGVALFTTLEGGAAARGMLPSVWILHEDQAVQAAALVARFADGKPLPEDAGEPWVCLACGERHEAQFTQCWKCGADRP
jgi:hypothetical protein